jgi:hypothetical protein
MKKVHQSRSRRRNLWLQMKQRRRRTRLQIVRAAVRSFRQSLRHNRPVRAAHLALRSVPLDHKRDVGDLLERLFSKNERIYEIRFIRELGSFPRF